MYYMLFFYVGYILQKEDISLDRFYTLKHCLAAALAFLVVFPTLTLIKANLGSLMGGANLSENQLSIKILSFFLSKFMQIIYASMGLWMLLLWVGYGEKNRKEEMSQRIIEFGNLCMGVYLLQQFILIGLYDHTALPYLFGCYWLPWVGFVIAFIGSVFISQLLLKTKVGKFLIG